MTLLENLFYPLYLLVYSYFYTKHKLWEFSRTYTITMTRKLKQWWSTILPISTPVYTDKCIACHRQIVCVKSVQKINYIKVSCNFNFASLICLNMHMNPPSTMNVWRGPSWSWSHGSWIYNYLCNQCLSPLILWVPISIRARCGKVC